MAGKPRRAQLQARQTCQKRHPLPRAQHHGTTHNYYYYSRRHHLKGLKLNSLADLHRYRVCGIHGYNYLNYEQAHELRALVDDELPRMEESGRLAEIWRKYAR